MPVSPELKLRCYNEALRHLGERQLGSLDEAREPRRVLDTAWQPLFYLERGEWNFAMRTVEAIPSPSVEPSFGFARAYDQPADFIRLAAIGDDPLFLRPLTGRQYADEAGYWFTDQEPLYVKYVSSDDAYGLDGTRWTPSFFRFVGAQLAADTCMRITNSDQKLAALLKIAEDYRDKSVARDNMDEGARFLPAGSWVRSRCR